MSLPSQKLPVRVLFVCLGNICRSPTAEGVFRKLVEQNNLAHHIQIDSAGTSSYHLGEPPDPRAQVAAKMRGINLSGLKARQTSESDFAHFDYILAMDKDNHAKLLGQCPPGQENRIHMFLKFAPGASRTDVPDPYMSDTHGFEMVLDLIEEASEGLLDYICKQSDLMPRP